MNPAFRIVLKVSWMFVMVVLLSMFAREAVDFVYTGF
jgi:hypothetical protein